MSQKPGSQKGVTLVEAVIALGILLPVMLTVLFVLMNAHQISQEARQRLLALNAARSVLEVVKDTPLLNVPAINTAPYVPGELVNGAIAIATNPANLANVNLATVTVSVSWRGPRNRPYALEVSTMRSRY